MNRKTYYLSYINKQGQKVGYKVTGTDLDIAIEKIHISKLGGINLRLKEAIKND